MKRGAKSGDRGWGEGSGGWNKNKCEGYTEGGRDGKKNERYNGRTIERQL